MGGGDLRVDGAQVLSGRSRCLWCGYDRRANLKNLDRLADLLVLVPAASAISWIGWGPELGWAAGVLAVLTAYVRLLGGSLGLEQRFSGPMAKPHRMFVLTLACIAAAVEAAAAAQFEGAALTVGLVVIAAGSALTFAVRLARIAAELPEA